MSNPGLTTLSFNNVMLVKDKFWRDYQVPNDVSANVAFNVAVSNTDKDSDNLTAEVETMLKLVTDDNKPHVELECTFVGFFSIERGSDYEEKIELLKSVSVPTIMFPYIREHISSITAKAGITPVILPPMNISMLNQISEDKE